MIDPVARRVDERRIDDRPQEFPRHNPTVGLQRHRYGYTSEVIPGGPNLHGAIIKLDVEAATTEAHELHILDAGDITGDAVATISLPQRVPFGFHGNWVSDSSVPPPT